ncbi:MAG: IS630 family transposase [Ignavibacteria bacterium]|nr:IS630 family transposase [Ignavibacteria bacterium]
MERRRRQAIRLLRQRKSVSAIARLLAASKSSIVRWRDAYKKHGFKGLRPRPTPGRPPRLSMAQKVKLAKYLLKGSLAVGYSTDLWTLQRISTLIEKRFQVSYHPNHVWRLLLSMGWSCQKPERRALQRDEEAIAHWGPTRMDSDKKNRKTWRPSRIHG